MRLTPEQQAELATLAAMNAEYRTAKLTAAARLAQLVDEEVEAAKIKRDVYAFQLHALGIPKTRIGKSMGTSAAITVNQAIENGAKYSTPATLASLNNPDPSNPNNPGNSTATFADAFTGYREGSDPRYPFLFEFTSPKTQRTITASYNPDTDSLDFPDLWDDNVQSDLDTITELQHRDATAAAIAWATAR